MPTDGDDGNENSYRDYPTDDDCVVVDDDDDGDDDYISYRS